MAEEEWHIVGLDDDFYRDSFGKVIFLSMSVCFAIVLLAGLSIYLHLNKPKPVNFAVGADWRIQPAVPIDRPYLSTPDLLQWVSDVLRKVFVLDFNQYNDQLKLSQQYFTSDGWSVFLNQLNNYANYNNVKVSKLFVNGTPAGAPFILNQGLLSGRYAWWVQMPIDLQYQGGASLPNRSLTLQILVVRIPTVNNLSGVAIDNVIVASGAGASTSS
ncbi:MAG: hypothetical protein ACD_46C00488G0006 [uncultured bacterium]|nr:MAG: hypothetical protein ACD_46C00488G0006 [uncultured bacterium]